MLQKINIVPRWIIFLIDLSICNFSLVVAYLIGHNLNFNLISLRELSSNLLVLSVLNTLIFFNFKTYAGIVRYTGVQDAFRVTYSLLVSTGILGFLSLVSLANDKSFISLPLVTLIIYAIFSFLNLIAYRVLIKYAFNYLRNSRRIRE